MSLYGEVQKEVIQATLERDYGIAADFGGRGFAWSRGRADPSALERIARRPSLAYLKRCGRYGLANFYVYAICTHKPSEAWLPMWTET